MTDTPAEMPPADEMSAPAIPVTVLTGFLGSGKTTLLNRLLEHPGLADTAVLINEFGEIGIDHLLVRALDETTVLLNSGCLCCTVREDLVVTLRDLFRKRAKGEVPPFQRVVIETTGLADPAPILHTLMTDLVLANRYRLDGIVTCIDAVNGSRQLDEHSEAVKQAAVADRIVFTKTDIADSAATDGLTKRLAMLNPAAPRIRARQGDINPADILDAGLFKVDSKIAEVEDWLRAEAYAATPHDHEHHHHHNVNRHDDRISAFCMTVEGALPWDRFVEWIEMLIATQGERLLRIKGVLDIEGEPAPIAVHGVQHVFHPPAALDGWPDGPKRSRLVIIARDLGATAIKETFEAFVEHRVLPDA